MKYRSFILLLHVEMQWEVLFGHSRTFLSSSINNHLFHKLQPVCVHCVETTCQNWLFTMYYSSNQQWNVNWSCIEWNMYNKYRCCWKLRMPLLIRFIAPGGSDEATRNKLFFDAFYCQSGVLIIWTLLIWQHTVQIILFLHALVLSVHL